MLVGVLIKADFHFSFVPQTSLVSINVLRRKDSIMLDAARGWTQWISRPIQVRSDVGCRAHWHATRSPLSMRTESSTQY